MELFKSFRKNVLLLMNYIKKDYLTSLSDILKNFIVFSTIGVNGMNEMVRNFRIANMIFFMK